MARLVILDFDGTMTDAEREGAPFRTGYLEDVAALCGASLERVLELAEQFEAEIAADPDRFGWVYDGQIVAPATVDPYLRIMPVARKIFDEFGAFSDERDRTRLLDAVLYKYNYHKTETAFRPGAREALLALAGTETYVVTNSHTIPVQNKIRALGGDADDLGWLVERVHGRAKKYAVDNTLDTVDEALALPGLSRPVLLRRRHYLDVLDELRARTGAAWADVVVIGDIFELDLALPLALGARVGLMVNEFTPRYERDYVEAHPRGAVLAAADAIPGFAAAG